MNALYPCKNGPGQCTVHSDRLGLNCLHAACRNADWNVTVGTCTVLVRATLLKFDYVDRHTNANARNVVHLSVPYMRMPIHRAHQRRLHEPLAQIDSDEVFRIAAGGFRTDCPESPCLLSLAHIGRTWPGPNAPVRPNLRPPAPSAISAQADLISESTFSSRSVT